MRTVTLGLVLCASAVCAQVEVAVWPQPSSMDLTGTVLPVDMTAFQVSNVGAGSDSDILNAAITRYASIYALEVLSPVVYPAPTGTALTTLKVEAGSGSEDLSMDTNESYVLEISTAGVSLASPSIYGAMRGLETLGQLMLWSGASGSFLLPAGSVEDSPRFAFRGILLDSARHFLTPSVLYPFIDAMSYNKYNVLHWHIVDSQAFPYPSDAFPALQGEGAWGSINSKDEGYPVETPYTGPLPSVVHANHGYTREEVASVIQYAKSRGVRVVPEFDTPGHVDDAWLGIHGLLTQCYNVTTGAPIPGSYGPVNPLSNSTWTFLQNFFGEVADTFPDSYVHLGGDEVSFSCWQSNPAIRAWMTGQGHDPDNYTAYAALETFYESRLTSLVGGSSVNRSYVVWQEVFDNGVSIKDDTVVEVWRATSQNGLSWQEELGAVTDAGYRAILSAPWYLNYISYGEDWPKYYASDPGNFTGSQSQKELVMGGEACFWGEFIDATNLLSRAWPRAGAIAERLWSPEDVVDIDDATRRMHAHRCRLLTRGIPAEPPSGPSFCPQEWEVQYSPPWQA